MNIPAHQMDAEALKQKTDNAGAFLADILPMIPQRSDLLPEYALQSQAYAGGLNGLHRDDEVAEWLRRSARASALMFVHASHSVEPTSIELSETVTATVTQPIDAFETHAAAWVEAMWCALAVDDPVAQHWLATVPSAVFQESEFVHNEYVFALADLLRSLVLRDGKHGDALVRATELCEPSSADLEHTRDWITGVDEPALKAMFLAFDRDQSGFTAAMRELFERHRAYFDTDHNRLSLTGLLSTRACALMRIAQMLRLQREVQSAYAPQSVLTAQPAAPLMLCSYCALPKSPAIQRCGLCGRNTRADAPLESTPQAYRTQARKSCPVCHFLMPQLAVTCGRCRSQVTSS